MSNEPKPVLGKCRCPICNTPDQEVRASAAQRPYLMCDECDVQIFARSKRSGAALVALIEAPAPTPTPQPKKADETKPAPAAKPAPAPAAGAKPRGLFGRG